MSKPALTALQIEVLEVMAAGGELEVVVSPRADTGYDAHINVLARVRMPTVMILIDRGLIAKKRKRGRQSGDIDGKYTITDTGRAAIAQVTATGDER